MTEKKIQSISTVLTSEAESDVLTSSRGRVVEKEEDLTRIDST